ncbi:mobilization protein, partial [Staphylococcus epidermidis]|nr:mobilization protein [Staphylococcus epidermidis]
FITGIDLYISYKKKKARDNNGNN